MSRNDSKYFSTTKKGEIPELKEELNSQYKVPTFTPSISSDPFLSDLILFIVISLFVPHAADL